MEGREEMPELEGGTVGLPGNKEGGWRARSHMLHDTHTSDLCSNPYV